LNENDFCSGVYREVQDRGLSGWYVRQSHISLERLPDESHGLKILEVGGNIGEHINYVNQSFSTYTLTDYRDTKFTSTDKRILFKVADVEKLPFSDNEFDRTLSTCLLHHVGNPLIALNEIRRVTKVGGIISLLIPCDPGLAYRIAKKIGVSKKWKVNGISSPEFFHYSQHRNHYPGLNSFINEVFKKDIVLKKNWPFPLNSWNLNLFSTFQIVKDDF
jgi:phosphatidylethanolamine/phosphatidyl-N-methylethanolamine N-methyltransferase